MILRLARRLRLALLPLQALAVLGFQGRLGWAHDPTCPHHAGHAAHQMAPQATHGAHPGMAHAGMAHDAMAHAGMAHDAMAHDAMAHEAGPSPTSSPDGSNVPCKCLDPDCCFTGVAAVHAAPPVVAIHGGDLAANEAARRLPASVVPPSAYRTHRLPFPLAPPPLDGLS
ncbi:MAG: hypothetical protein ACYC7F_02415 [Gemmatimonadaceae bacterium]